MGTIKLDKDEMLKIASELSVLKDQINNILNKLLETENVLRREKSVSTYSQRKKLNDVQDLAYNLVKEFDIISDDFYNAAKTMDLVNEEILNKISFNKINMGITMEKVNINKEDGIKSEVPEEYSNFKDYFVSEENAFKMIFTSFLKLIKCKNIYSGSEIKDMPKRIAYRKDGYLYIYELKETPIYSLFGTDFYGDFGIYELTGDKEYADRFKKYQYVQVYSTEPEVSYGIVSIGKNDIKNFEGLDNVCTYRKQSLKKIKAELNIPRCQQPIKQEMVHLTDSNGNWILGENKLPVMSRELTYEVNGDKIVIQDHSFGHDFDEGGIGNQPSHHNVRPIENTRTGKVKGLKDHYYFIKRNS